MSPVFSRPKPTLELVTHRRGVPLRARLILGMVVLAAILTAPLVVTRYSLKNLIREIEQLQSQDFRAQATEQQ